MEEFVLFQVGQSYSLRWLDLDEPVYHILSILAHDFVNVGLRPVDVARQDVLLDLGRV